MWTKVRYKDMDLQQLLQAITRAKKEIENALLQEGTIAGADAAALVENRVVSKGETASGGHFTPYSTKQVPAYLYIGRSRNSAGENAVRRRAKDRQGISYREFRQVNGLNTNVKNFQFTGEMWQGFGVKSVRVVGRGIVEVTIGGKTNYSEKLIGYHSDREGSNIIDPSEKEKQLVLNGVQSRLMGIIKRNLGV